MSLSRLLLFCGLALGCAPPCGSCVAFRPHSVGFTGRWEPLAPHSWVTADKLLLVPTGTGVPCEAHTRVTRNRSLRPKEQLIGVSRLLPTQHHQSISPITQRGSRDAGNLLPLSAGSLPTIIRRFRRALDLRKTHTRVVKNRSLHPKEQTNWCSDNPSTISASHKCTSTMHSSRLHLNRFL
jgi:hypothetical protein